MADFAVNIILKADDQASSVVKSLVRETKALKFGALGSLAGPRGDSFEGSIGGGFDLAGGMAATGHAITRVAAVSERALWDIMGTAADFERTMSEVMAFGGAAFQPFAQQLEDKARELGRETEFKASDAAQAMRVLAQAGMEPQQILSSLPDILNSAMAGSTNLAQAAGTVSAAMAMYSDQGLEAKRISDLLATGTNITQASFTNFGASLQYVGGTAANMGIKFEDTIALLAAQGKQALNSSRAGTSLNAMLSKMSDVAVRGNNAMNGLLKRTKTSKKEFKGLLDEGNVTGALQLLVKNLDAAGLSATTQAKLLDEAFGKQGVRAFNSIANAMRDTEDGFDKIVDSLDNADGSGEKMAKQMGDNLTGAARQWTSAMEDAKLAIADELGPVIRDLIEDGTKLVKSFSEWVGENRDLIKTWGPLIVKLVIAGKVFGPLLTSTASMIRLGKDLAPVLGKLATKAGATSTSMTELAGASNLTKLRAAGLVVTAALVGYEFGQWADKTFGLSDAFAGLNSNIRDNQALTKVRGATLLSDLTEEERGQLQEAQKRRDQLIEERAQSEDSLKHFLLGKDSSFFGISVGDGRGVEHIEEDIARQQHIIDQLNERGMRRGRERAPQEAETIGSVQAREEARAAAMVEQMSSNIQALVEQSLKVSIEIDNKGQGRVRDVRSSKGIEPSVSTGITPGGL